VNRAKKLLMARRAMSEEKAHKLLQNTARTRGISMEEAAEELLRRLTED
jgi:AmiR/NasT family two-component response regulator